MMDLPSQQGPPTMVTFAPAPLRMSFAGMPPKLDITCPVVSAGIATVFPSSTKSTRLSTSPTRDKLSKWALRSTTTSAGPLSWDTPQSGNTLSTDSAGGSTSKMTTRPSISTSWSQSGMCSRPCSTRGWCTEEERSCHTQMQCTQYCPISRCNWTTNK